MPQALDSRRCRSASRPTGACASSCARAPGSVTLTARNDAPTARIARPRPDGPWKEGEEVWVFESRPPLRVVTVEGVPGVDPQQTTLPDEWRRCPRT